jgi:retinol dehydrogenase-12
MFTFINELFPPKPTFWEKDFAPQNGRVFIVTGGASGLGFEVAKALYHLNGRVYIAGRSKDKAVAAIDEIKASAPPPGLTINSGEGEVFFLQLDLADLSTIKSTAESFLARESRLDVIFHNAGCMASPQGCFSAQKFDMELATNALGPFLLQYYLNPLCLSTLKLPSTRPNATRVVFVSSFAHRASPKPDGVQWDDLNLSNHSGVMAKSLKYGQSKAMAAMLAHELARRHAKEGLVVLALHPGNLVTNIQRHAPGWYNAIFQWFRYPSRYGGLTELFAGLNEEVNTTLLEDGGWNGGYIHPFGKFGACEDHVFDGLLERETGQRLWNVFEGLVKEYL